MPNRISTRMQELHSTGGKALVVVLMLGDPDFETTFELAQIYVDQGVDVIELGIPTSRAYLDSETMRESNSRALACSSDYQRYLDAIGEMRAQNPEWPLNVMIYRDTVDEIGLERFCQALGDAEIDAALVADIADQSDDFRRNLDTQLLKQDIIPLRFMPHPFRPEQVDDLRENGRGFIIVQTMTDAEGQRKTVLPANKQTLDTLRNAGIHTPLLMAYGIKTPEHIHKCVALGADGVVIGTVVLDAAYRLPRAEFAAMLAELHKAVAP